MPIGPHFSKGNDGVTRRMSGPWSDRYHELQAELADKKYSDDTEALAAARAEAEAELSHDPAEDTGLDWMTRLVVADSAAFEAYFNASRRMEEIAQRLAEEGLDPAGDEWVPVSQPEAS